MSSVEIKEMKPAAYRRILKRLSLLRLMVKYLETGPTEEFVLAEIKRCENLVSVKMKEFRSDEYADLPKKEVSKLKKAHENKYDLSKYRTQIRTMRLLFK